MAGADILTKIVAFFVEVEASNNVEKKIRKKTYWMADDGYCFEARREQFPRRRFDFWQYGAILNAWTFGVSLIGLAIILSSY